MYQTDPHSEYLFKVKVEESALEEIAESFVGTQTHEARCLEHSELPQH